MSIRRVLEDLRMNAGRRTEGLAWRDDDLAEQALQLGGIEAVAADDAAVEKQDGDIESVATLEDGVAIDVDDFDGGQGSRASQGVQLGQHLVA
jgi:hypothetical protein